MKLEDQVPQVSWTCRVLAAGDQIERTVEAVGLSLRWKVLHLVRDCVNRHGELRVPPEVSGGGLPGACLGTVGAVGAGHMFPRGLSDLGHRPIVVFDGVTNRAKRGEKVSSYFRTQTLLSQANA